MMRKGSLITCGTEHGITVDLLIMRFIMMNHDFTFLTNCLTKGADEVLLFVNISNDTCEPYIIINLGF